VRWSCAFCGRTWAEVDAWRRRRGMPVLQVTAVTCGRASCKRAHLREKRLEYFRARYARARTNPRPERPSGPWRCAVCGIGLEGAKAARRRRGLRQTSPAPYATCSPECSREWRARYSRAVFGARKPAE